MTNKQKSVAFSNGEFEKVFDFLSDQAVWTVIGETTFAGKQSIIENCKQVSSYFKSMTTIFETLHVIEEDNKVLVSGTAEFLQEDKQRSFVYACDIYEFDDQDEIENITSYCIEKKVG